MVKQVAGVKAIVDGGLGHTKHHFLRAEAGDNSALRGRNMVDSADRLDLKARAHSMGERYPLHPVSSKSVFCASHKAKWRATLSALRS